jgi:sec-independent protein translocase protein TatA
VFDIGGGELLLILVVALLLFGGRLPDVARSLGRTVSDLKRGLAEGTRPLREAGAAVEREVAEIGDERTARRAAPGAPTPPPPPPSRPSPG